MKKIESLLLTTITKGSILLRLIRVAFDAIGKNVVLRM